MPVLLRFTASLPQNAQEYLARGGRAVAGRVGNTSFIGAARVAALANRQRLAPRQRPTAARQQTHLACWLISIFLTILRSEAPNRVPYLPTMPTFFVRRCGRGEEAGEGGAVGRGHAETIDTARPFTHRHAKQAKR